MPNLFDMVNKKGFSQKVTCGLSGIDDTIGGFTYGGNYLLAGHRKSGKSSLLAGFINHWLSKEISVGYLNSEMDERDLLEMLQANFFNKPKKELKYNDDIQYKNRFERILLYSSPDDLSDSLGLSVVKIESEIKKLIREGAKIIVVDNLTKLQESAQAGTPGYQIIAKGVSTITTLCRQNNILAFTVLHTKDDLMFTETPEGIAKAVEDKLPEKIFDKSVTILKKPSSASIYGGGSTKTNLRGTLLLWRPYQEFSDIHYKELSQLIFEDFRGEAHPDALRLLFDGSKNKFIEDILEVAKNIFNEDVTQTDQEKQEKTAKEIPF